MYVPRRLYEALPYAYVGGGTVLGLLSFLRPGAPWSDVALAVGTAVVVTGLVLLMRRRSYRADAARYDGRSLDDA